MGQGAYISVINATSTEFNQYGGGYDYISESHHLGSKKQPIVIGELSHQVGAYVEYNGGHSGHFWLKFVSSDGRHDVSVKFSDFHIQNSSDMTRLSDGSLFLWVRVSPADQLSSGQTQIDIYLSNHKQDDDKFLRSWMERLPNARSLASLRLIGTHDSGSYKSDTPRVNCQNQDLSTQLALGARFLDIRLGIHNDKLAIFHGPLYVYLHFQDVAQTLSDFLRQQPTETVIMSLKIDDKSDPTRIRGLLEPIMAEFTNLFLKTQKIPTLGEARGKVLVMDRNVGLSGAQSMSWPNDPTEYVDHPDHVTVCDNYDGGTKESRYEVARNYLKKYCLNSTYNEGDWYNLCFITASGKLNSPSVINSPGDYANYVTPRIYEYLCRDFGQPWSGMILMDFLDGTTYKKSLGVMVAMQNWANSQYSN